MLTDWDITPDLIEHINLTLGGISGSNLTLLAESNKHLDNKHLFNLGDSPALLFGTLLHTFVLEPREIEKNYVVLPEYNLRTNEGKQKKKDFEAANLGKIVVDASDFEKAKNMARNVMSVCGGIIESGIKERSLFVDINGLILKSRLDCDVENVGDDYDLKSITLGTKDFSNSTIEQHIKKFNYHRSAAFRNIIRRSLGKPVRDSYLIFCSTAAGYMVRVIKMNQDWIKSAEAEVNELLESRVFYLSSKIDIPTTIIDDRYRNKY